MEQTISKVDQDTLIRFIEIYAALSEENKKLVFAFAQGVETWHLISQDKQFSVGYTAAGA